MGRRQDSFPVRLPGDLWRSRGGDERPPTEGSLRLAVSRQGLGLELSQPTPLQAGLLIEEISVSLPHLRFPLDLSGGVPRFRHCRGRLERLVVQLQRSALESWAASTLVGLLGDGTPSLTVAPVKGGFSLGLALETRALAWELLWVPLGSDLCLVVQEPRAIGIEAPALAVALQASERLLGGWSRRAGSLFRAMDAPRAILREIWLPAGARLPASGGVVWSKAELEADALRLIAERGGLPVQVSPEAIRSLELAELLQDGDDALAQGDLEGAREVYLRAFERAPRQREIALRLADLDRSVGGRIEAALSTLVTALPAVHAGALGGLLLLGVADREGARVAFERAAASELHPAFAALCLVEAAALVDSPGEKASLLGAAVVRSPLLRVARWRRLDALLALGDARGALAEAEHLEASVRDSAARVEVLLRAGGLMLTRGMGAQALSIFERALRIRPSSEEGLLGLAEALFHLGEAARAAEVLGRAMALAEAQGRPDARAGLLLARVLAEGLHELPLAVARARAIPPGSAEGLEARLLEGRCLAQLGDRTGASLAFASLRDGVEHGRAQDPRKAIPWLQEAARFEEEERGDLAAAKRHLGVALRILPRDTGLLASFRRVAQLHEQELEALRRPGPVLVPVEPDASPSASSPEVPAEEPEAGASEEPEEPEGSMATGPEVPAEETGARGFPGGLRLEDEGGGENAEAEARAEQLAEQVRADPTNLEVVLELAGLLEVLGRDLDLFALLSARLEEGDEETREMLKPLQKAVLRRLAETARREGREGEASLYEQMMTMFS